MENKVVGVLIASFIVIVLGITFLNQIANNISSSTSLTTINNDLFTASNTSCVRLSSSDCVYSLTSIKNTTETLGAGNYTVCSTTNGVNDGVILNNNIKSYSGNSLNATYVQNNNCSYVENSTARTLLGIVIIFFALALVAASIFYLYKTGILDFTNK